MFVVATYNVLATAYIRADWYPLTPPALLRAEQRVAGVARRLMEIEADILCLQEVERATFAVYSDCLAALGYSGRYAPRPGKPDGCATFVRGPRASWHADEAIGLDIANRSTRTRRIAQIAAIDVDGRRLVAVNAHLEWDAPNTPSSLLVAPRQAAVILEKRTAWHGCAGIVVCGDFNATPDSVVVASMRAAGFAIAHGDRPPPTCNASRQARAIDYLFHDRRLVASPLPVRAVDNDTPLPGPDEPSDHVPLGAKFSWDDRHRVLRPRANLIGSIPGA